jgi:hypothetical protein
MNDPQVPQSLSRNDWSKCGYELLGAWAYHCIYHNQIAYQQYPVRVSGICWWGDCLSNEWSILMKAKVDSRYKTQREEAKERQLPRIQGNRDAPCGSVPPLSVYASCISQTPFCTIMLIRGCLSLECILLARSIISRGTRSGTVWSLCLLNGKSGKSIFSSTSVILQWFTYIGW